MLPASYSNATADVSSLRGTMMASDVHMASQLLAALEGLPHIRKALERKPRYDDPLTLQIEAFEGDDEGGIGHADIRLPRRFAPIVLDHLENVLRAELERLGVKNLSAHQ